MSIHQVAAAIPLIPALVAHLYASIDAPEQIIKYKVILANERAIAAFKAAVHQQFAGQICFLPALYSLATLDDVHLPSPKRQALSQNALRLYLVRWIEQRAQGVQLDILQLADSYVSVISEAHRAGMATSALASKLAEFVRNSPLPLPHLQLLIDVLQHDLLPFCQATEMLPPIEFRNQQLHAFIRHNLEQAQPVVIAGLMPTQPALAEAMHMVAEHAYGTLLVQGVAAHEQALPPTHPHAIMQGWLVATANEPPAAPPACIAAANLEEEASVIALYLQESAASHIQAALITESLQLRTRVRTKLAARGVRVDDSLGEAMLDTAPVKLLFALYEFVMRPTVGNLLGWAKHPIIPMAIRRVVFELEKDELRQLGGNALVGGYSKLPCLAQLEPLTMLAQGKVTLAAILRCHLEVALSIAPNLWANDVGQQAREALEQVAVDCQLLAPIHARDYLYWLRGLLKQSRYRPRYGVHPTIQILSAQEAVGLPLARAIIGGLNQGSWPQDPPAANPYVPLDFRQQFGLFKRELNYSLASWQLNQLAYIPETIFTYAHNSAAGSPLALSPLVARYQLQLLLQGISWQASPRYDWLELARAEVQVARSRIQPPAANPPMSARPQQFSITQVEALLNQPYAYYLTYILSLRPLDPLYAQFSRREFGIWLHAICEDVGRQLYSEGCKKNILELFEQAAMRHLQVKSWEQASVQSLWQPRCTKILQWLANYEQATLASGVSAEVEVQHAYKWQDFTLVGKADRLEHTATESTIIDYKTGTLPSQRAVVSGTSPQLPLLALLFAPQATKLSYFHLTGGNPAVSVMPISANTEELVETAKDGLNAIVQHYYQQASPYTAIYQRSSNMAVMLRCAEWA